MGDPMRIIVFGNLTYCVGIVRKYDCVLQVHVVGS